MMIFEYAVNLFETVLFTWFLYMLSDRKTNRKKNIIFTVLFIIIDFVFITYINNFLESESLLFILEVLLFYIYVSFISDSSFAKKLLICTLPNNIIGIINTLLTVTVSYAAFGCVDYTRLMNGFRIPMVVLSQLIHCAAFGAAVYIKYKLKPVVSGKDFIMLAVVFTLCNLITICFEGVLLHIGNDDMYMILGIYTSLTFIICIVLLFHSIYLHSVQEQKQRFELDMLKYQEMTYEQILSSQKELHQLRHDMKHYIQLMDQLRSENQTGNTERLNKTIEQYESMIMSSFVPVETPSQALNYAINIKLEEALKKEIFMGVNINIQNDLNMEDSDIFLLVSNILDNAIQHIGIEKKIMFEVREQGEMIVMKLTNSIDINLLNSENEILPAYRNDEHGFGIKTIQNILDRYDGHLMFREESGNFITSLMFVNKPFSVRGGSHS